MGGETSQPHHRHGRNLSYHQGRTGASSAVVDAGVLYAGLAFWKQICFSANWLHVLRAGRSSSPAPSEWQSPPAQHFHCMLSCCLLPVPPCLLRAAAPWLLGVPHSQPPLSKCNNKYSQSIKRASSAWLFALDAKNGPGQLGASSVIDHAQHPLAQ